MLQVNGKFLYRVVYVTGVKGHQATSLTVGVESCCPTWPVSTSMV